MYMRIRLLITLSFIFIQHFICIGQTIDDFMNEANKRIEFGNIEGAIEEFDLLLAKFPKNSITYFDRAMMKGKINNTIGAIDDFGKAIATDTIPNPDNYYLRGKQKEKLNDHKGAIDDYSHALSLESDNADAYYFRGRAKANLLDFDKALLDYTEAIKIRTNHAEAYAYRGWAKAQLHQYMAALADLDSAIYFAPELISAYYFRGKTKGEMNRKWEAIQDFAKAINLKTDANRAFEDDLSLNISAKKYKHSLNKYCRSILVSNDSAYLRMALLKAYLHQYKSALRDYNTLLMMNPNIEMGYYGRGIARMNTKDYAGAIQDFSNAFVINPVNKEAIKNRGLAKALSNDYLGAIQDYDRLIEMDKYNASYYLTRGEWKLIIGQLENGCKDIAKYNALGGTYGKAAMKLPCK